MSHRYRAEARLLCGHFIYPAQLKIEDQALVSLQSEQPARIVRHIERYDADEMISFRSGYTCVAGSYSERHGWMTLSTAVVEQLNVFEVITVDRAVAQVFTEHPDRKGRDPEYIPKVTFLGTRLENLCIGGYPIQVEFDLGILGAKPEGDRSYLEDSDFLSRVMDRLDNILHARNLPPGIKDEYRSRLDGIYALTKRGVQHGKGDWNDYPTVRCPLVKGIGPIPIPGAWTVGNLIFLPDFGVLTLAEVEVGIQPEDLEPPGKTGRSARDVLSQNNYFDLTMLSMRMGSIGGGNAEAATARVGGTTTVAGPERPTSAMPTVSFDSLPAALPERPLITRSPAAAHSDEFTKAFSPHSPTLPEAVTRYPTIDLIGEHRPKREVLLTIDLAMLPDPRTEASSVTVTAPAGWTELRIQAEITASALRFNPGQDSGTIVVHNRAVSEPYRVKAWVIGDLGEPDAIEVRATFYYEGRNCGSARRAFPISEILEAAPGRTPAIADLPAATTIPTREEEQRTARIADEVRSMALPEKSVIPQSRRESAPTGHTAGSLVATSGAKPPKLTIEIHLPDSRKEGQQRWHLAVPDSVREECTLPDNLSHDVYLKRDEPKYVADLFAALEDIAPGQHMSFFQGLGDFLYQVTPPCFKELYWLLFDKYGNFPIQILSDDPYMPWELMRPTRPDGDERGPDREILARRHPVGRWFLYKEGSLHPYPKAGKVATIAPDYSKRKEIEPLPSAQAESRNIRAKLGAHAIPVSGRKQQVIEMFEDAKKEAIGMVHYAGHGASKVEQVAFAQLFLEDSDLLVYDIRRKETQLGKHRRSLVFFNACQVGVSGLNLGVIGGFAEALIEDKFGGFVAPLWSVYDTDASTVVLDFLEHVLLAEGDERQTFATALQKIRSEYGEQSPTFLSYVYYGDVMASFV